MTIAWRGAVWLMAAALTGCDGWQWAATTGPVDGAQIPSALESAAVQFMGADTAGGGGVGLAAGASGGGAGGQAGPALRLPGLGRDTLSPDSDTAYAVVRNRSVGVRGEYTVPLRGAVSGFAAVTGGVGWHDHDLPEGLGPLSDPISITMRLRQMGVEAGLRREVPFDGGAMRLSLAVGADQVHTRTTIRSALLDVTSDDRRKVGHVTLGSALAWQPGRAEIVLRGDIRAYQSGERVARTELRISPRRRVP